MSQKQGYLFGIDFLGVQIVAKEVMESRCLYWGPNPQSQFRDLDKPKPFIVSLTAIQLQTLYYSREHNILEHGGAYTMHRCMMLEHIQFLVPWRTQALELLPEYEELCRELDLDRGLGASAAQ